MGITLSQQKLIKISDILCDNIDMVLEKLGVNLNSNFKYYFGKCPVHGGDNGNGILLYPDGHTHRGYWRCTTHGCHEVFKPTIIGFIRGALSHNNYGWHTKGDKFETFDNTLRFISETIKLDLDKIEVNHEELEKKRFSSQIRWNIPMNKDKPLITRKEVQSRLHHPPRYFIDRGFSEGILRKYDVAFCKDPKKPMYKRCVVPVYDDGYNYLVGCIGRSIYEKCQKCSQFHNPYDIKCPSYESPKWKMSKNFSKSNSLYNYWIAKEYIKRSKTAILVESCGNVWRLEEANVNNSVALFGAELSDGQEFLLEKLGCMRIIIIMDGDEAGRKATQRIIEKTKNLYNVKPIYIDSGDISDMSVDQIRKDIVPNL